MTVWDPITYLEFADERSRPFVDLLSRVDAAEPTVVVDLGCGPGQLTASLADRWPNAQIVGLDSSPEMIKRAARFAGPRVRFQLQDLRDWRPETSVDVIISNATLQWVPGHRDLLPSLVSSLSPRRMAGLSGAGKLRRAQSSAASPVGRRPALRAIADRSRLADRSRRGVLSR